MFITALTVFCLSIAATIVNLTGENHLPRWLQAATDVKIILPISIMSFIIMLVAG